MPTAPTVSCPAMSAFDAVSPVFVSVFPEPALNPVGVTVAESVPSFTVRPEDARVDPVAEVPANTVPVVVRPESVRPDAPVEKDSDVTPLPVIFVLDAVSPTVTEVAAATVVYEGFAEVEIVSVPVLESSALRLSSVA